MASGDHPVTTHGHSPQSGVHDASDRLARHRVTDDPGGHGPTATAAADSAAGRDGIADRNGPGSIGSRANATQAARVAASRATAEGR